MPDPRSDPATTKIAVHRDDGVEIRGLSLETDLIGRASYADLIMLGTLGRLPEPPQRRLLDGCLVALMEGGLNPSTLVTRMVAMTVPDQPQAAMAAGLLTVGDRFVGSVQACADLLASIATGDDPERAATVAVSELTDRGLRIPGLGHGRHRGDDPRAEALRSLAAANDCAGSHLAALATLRTAAEHRLGRSLVINVTGAVAGALLDLGFPTTAARPIAVAARAGGLVGHIVEEQRRPTANTQWTTALDQIRYRTGDEAGEERDEEP